MTFTKTPPTTPGFYAWRAHSLSVPAAAVVSWNSKLAAFDYRLSDASIGKADRMGGEWCLLVPAEEIEKAWDEHAAIDRDADGYADEFKAWQDSRAKRVMEGTWFLLWQAPA